MGWGICGVIGSWAVAEMDPSAVRVRAPAGEVEGVIERAGAVHAFKGIPFAAPPVGELRWQPPQPLAPWAGVRPANEFGARAMQTILWEKMQFRDNGPSEDCLYLNVWRPADAKVGSKLPVMVWIHGGGYLVGATSEPRQSGVNLAQKGVLVVSVAYRMGIFGFYSHPELTKEKRRKASGNYGLMDVVAGLEWVRNNIAAFGGNPDNVTIFGESAGSNIVNHLMASPVAKGLFHKAIGQSGSNFDQLLNSRKQADELGLNFAQRELGVTSLRELREIPAEVLLAATKNQRLFRPVIDGRFLKDDDVTTFKKGRQNSVPLLAGWTMDEGGAETFFKKDIPNEMNFRMRAHELFRENARAFLSVYVGNSDEEAHRAAKDYGTDLFIAHGVWRWLEAQQKTGEHPVFRYRFDQTLPLPVNAPEGAEPTASHAADIHYVFGNFEATPLPWRPQDRATSEHIMNYWTNFAKHGNPGEAGGVAWPKYSRENNYPVMHLKADPEVTFDDHRGRYEFLNQVSKY